MLFDACKHICTQTCLQNIMFENKLFCDFSCLFQLFNVSLHHKLIIKSQRYGK